MRLIDPKHLLDELDKDQPYNWTGSEAELTAEQDWDYFRLAVITAPIIDAVPVIRCHECGYSKKRIGDMVCTRWDYDEGEGPNVVNGDDFCSYGVRKDGTSNG